jgi:hypothetical protein
MFWPPGNCGFGILHRTGFDPTQYDPSQWDYVNETRGFVMELHFQSWAGLCDTIPRDTFDPPMPAAGGLFDRKPLDRSALGMGGCEPDGIDGPDLIVW